MVGAILFICFGIVCIYYALFKYDKKKLKEQRISSTGSHSFIGFILEALLIFLIKSLPSWLGRIVIILLSLLPIFIGVMLILQITGNL